MAMQLYLCSARGSLIRKLSRLRLTLKLRRWCRWSKRACNITRWNPRWIRYVFYFKRFLRAKDEGGEKTLSFWVQIQFKLIAIHRRAIIKAFHRLIIFSGQSHLKLEPNLGQWKVAMRLLAQNQIPRVNLRATAR